MKLIAGLGNPGSKYQNTRHNFGFMVVDSFVREQGFSWRISRDWICYNAKAQEYIVIKPSTFVNKSGEAVRSVAGFFKIESADILVVHDDLDLPFETIRLSFDSLSAGHKGVDSVIESLGGTNFARLRIGIDESKGGDAEKYVLEEFSQKEKGQLGQIIEKSVEAVKSYLADGIGATMNRFN